MLEPTNEVHVTFGKVKNGRMALKSLGTGPSVQHDELEHIKTKAVNRLP